MPTYLLVPSSETYTKGGVMWNPNDKAQRVTRLGDNSDSTYVLRTAPAAATLQYNFSAFTLPANEIVSSVRVVVRLQGAVGAKQPNAQALTYLHQGKIQANAGTVTGAPAAATTYKGKAFTTDPAGNPWTQDRVNSLRASISDGKKIGTSTAYAMRWVQLQLEVTTVSRPVVTVTAPSGTITNTSKPSVEWTFSDDSDGSQSSAIVRVFQRPGGSWPAGFDPDSSGNNAYRLLDASVSGEVFSQQVKDAIAPSTVCRAYVKAGKKNGSQEIRSAWAYSDFTVSPTPPTVPTFTSAAWSSSLQAAQFTITGAAAGGAFTSGSQRFRLQRSTDGGSTWVDIRGGIVTPNSSHVATIVDYEAPRTAAVKYRVAAYATTSGGNDVQSAWATAVTVTPVSDQRWWFKVCGTPANNWGGVRVTADPDINVVEQTGVFTPRGSDAHVVVSGGFYGATGSYQVYAGTGAEWASLVNVLYSDDRILVQDPFGEQRYVRITGRQVSTEGTAASPRRVAQIEWVQVDDGMG